MLLFMSQLLFFPLLDLLRQDFHSSFSTSSGARSSCPHGGRLIRHLSVWLFLPKLSGFTSILLTPSNPLPFHCPTQPKGPLVYSFTHSTLPITIPRSSSSFLPIPIFWSFFFCSFACLPLLFPVFLHLLCCLKLRQ